MKNNATKGFNETLGIEGEIIDEETPKNFPVPVKTRTKFEDIEDDYVYSRENIRGVIDKGTQALDFLFELAKQTEHPRAFEVIGQLSKTLLDANKDLLNVQKKVKELNEENPQNPDASKSITNNVAFFGTTAQLQKALEGEESEPILIEDDHGEEETDNL